MQPHDLGDRAARECLGEPLGELAFLRWCGLVERIPKVLRAVVRDLDCSVLGIGCERDPQSGLRARGEALTPGAEDMPDPVESFSSCGRDVRGLLLDPAANVVDRSSAELDDLERVQHAGRVRELVIDRVLVLLERVQRRDLDVLAEPLATFVQPILVCVP